VEKLGAGQKVRGPRPPGPGLEPPLGLRLEVQALALQNCSDIFGITLKITN